ncbi:Casein kinase I isoform gamma-2 [Tyrophagus putrescentiae]|nr:Casein kinase I isoform gamma-2 [Tyrophagus putrescentiae]
MPPKKTPSHAAPRQQKSKTKSKVKTRSKSKTKVKAESKSKTNVKDKAKMKTRSKSKSKTKTTPKHSHQRGSSGPPTVAAVPSSKAAAALDLDSSAPAAAPAAPAAPGDLLQNAVIHNRFRVDQPIGSGSFGQIRLGTDLDNGRPVAIKVAPFGDDQLNTETEIYLELRENPGFAQLLFGGAVGRLECIVVERFSRDLAKLLKQSPGHRLQLRTVLIFGVQAIERLRDLHNIHHIYRDIKPENFMLGLDDQTVKLIDFGLAERLFDHTGVHKPEGLTYEVIGTERYMSVNGHDGRQQSRRDDLESLGYLFLHLLSGRQPWEEVACDNFEQRNDLIADMKRCTPPSLLFKEFPAVFAEYLQYARSLSFAQKPDYEMLRTAFVQFFRLTFKDQKMLFDWSHLKG